MIQMGISDDFGMSRGGIDEMAMMDHDGLERMCPAVWQPQGPGQQQLRCFDTRSSGIPGACWDPPPVAPTSHIELPQMSWFQRRLERSANGGTIGTIGTWIDWYRQFLFSLYWFALGECPCAFSTTIPSLFRLRRSLWDFVSVDASQSCNYWFCFNTSATVHSVSLALLYTSAIKWRI
jgi:hypothetical protein